MFVVVGVFAQFILGIVALVTGVGGIIRKDGGKGSGILIGWVAGIPASLIAGIVITATLANCSRPGHRDRHGPAPRSRLALG